jgi:threonine/homoserine/homoserine lactone efflux protein
MFSIPNLSIFLLAALILLLTPGPAVLYIVARSLDQGRLAGFVSVLSIEVGNFVHVLAATLGLSAILVSSALAFSIVKYLGAAYLIYLGIRRLLARDTEHQPTTFKRQSLGRIFRQGVLVAILNPKTALFFSLFCHNLPIRQRAHLLSSCWPSGVCSYSWPLSQTVCMLF